MYTHYAYAVSGGEAPAAKRFPGYYTGLRERWMRKSGCYFFYHTPKKWGVRYPPLQKVGGTRTPRTLRKLRLCCL